MTRLRALWAYLRGTFWLVPSTMTLGAAALAFGMVWLDELATGEFIGQLSWVYTGGPDGAREVLSTIAGSMITVAGVSFSITIVALTLASQQFGPRILRNFLRDMGNQVVLGTFVSTFLYCLLVLRTVRGLEGTEFVPHLAVTTGVVLATFSLGVLIYFIHHVSTSIQATRIIANVAGDLDRAIDDLFPDKPGSEREASIPNDPAPTGPFDNDAPAVRARSAGYVQAIDYERLVRMAQEHKLVVRVEATPGTFVREGGHLLIAGRPLPVDGNDEQAFRSAFVIGSERADTQDITFFIDQLVELAVRALSPGINDPETARSCIDRLEHAACRMTGRQPPSSVRYDQDGQARVISPALTIETIAASAFEEIGRYGRASVSVTCRLLTAVESVGRCVNGEADRRALARLARDIAQRAGLSEFSDGDRGRIDARLRGAMAALGVEPHSSSTPM
jgi:uncharacterized membrane protein